MSMNYLEGYKACIDNAARLNKIATHSYQQSENGIATSLNVLACEEAIKALNLLLKHYFPETETPDFHKLFKDHKHKHNNLVWLSFAFFLKQIVYRSWFNEMEEFYDDMKASPINEDEVLIVKQYEWVNNNSISYVEVIKWLKEANNLKNNGFYVNIINGELKLPKDLAKEHFDTSQNFYEMLLGYIEMLEFSFSKTETAQRMKEVMKKYENLSFEELFSEVTDSKL